MWWSDVGLNRAIVVTECKTGVELEDTRTGLQITVRITAADNLITILLDELGFREELGVEDLRRLQRPLRRQWQEDVRAEALSELFEFADACVPFYRGRRRSSSSAVSARERLREFPVLGKTELRKLGLELLADNVLLARGGNSDEISWARTSGSTGDRVQVPVDMKLDRAPPGYQDCWGVQFKSEVPKTAVLTAPRCTAVECHFGLRERSDRLKWGTTLFLNSVQNLASLTDACVESFAQDLQEFRPEILLANPAYLQAFSEKAARLGLEFPKPSLILSTYQYLSEVQRTVLERRLECPVRNTYTATELGGCQIAIECRYGRWHIREDHCVIEVDQENADSRGVGPLLVTAVANRLMPLIRYRVGDLGRLVDDDCKCNLSDWQCIEMHGRESERLFVGTEQYTTRDVDMVMSEFDTIQSYQVSQSSDAATVTVELVPIAGVIPCHRLIADAFERSFGVAVTTSDAGLITQLESGKIPLVFQR